MDKRVLTGLVLTLIVLTVFGFYSIINKVTGNIVSNTEHTIGPSLEEQNCMRPCVSQGCNAGDMVCMKKNSEACLAECSIKKPEVTEETSCMEECVLFGCSDIDFECQNKNKNKCEKECNMIKEPEAKSEEEQCIRDCVNKINPGLICQASAEGETGNEVCQMCAKQCEHLYSGPCLGNEELKTKQKECVTCEHCYGEPVMGPSGEGWDCIINVECKDSSSEFGDNPGEGPGIGQEGYVASDESTLGNAVKSIGDVLGNVIESITNFFKGMFSGKTEQPTEALTNSE